VENKEIFDKDVYDLRQSIAAYRYLSDNKSPHDLILAWPDCPLKGKMLSLALDIAVMTSKILPEICHRMDKLHAENERLRGK